MIFVGRVDELKFSICTNRFLLKDLGYCATKYRTKQREIKKKYIYNNRKDLANSTKEEVNIKSNKNVHYRKKRNMYRRWKWIFLSPSSPHSLSLYFSLRRIPGNLATTWH